MEPLWSPSPERAQATRMAAFGRAVTERFGVELPDYAALHRWSIEHLPEFWETVWDECGVLGERGARTLVDAERMPGARFFPDARLSFAENLLRCDADAAALIFRREDGERRSLTFAELRRQVGSLARHLRAHGVEPGDRVAGYLPNAPETIVAMLAAASLGAVWSSCSPDFGVRGVLDRFSQIAPRVLITVDGYVYNGRRFDLGERIAEIRAGLPSVETVIVSPYLDADPDLPPGALRLDALVADDVAPPVERRAFDHPLYVLYSSGTTGKPKCIVHGAGGTLLQHLKEHQLHTDVGPDDRLFYFTTCGWMMWNWLVSGLASGATLVLYDGAPTHPGDAQLFDVADAEGITIFGTSAKYIDAIAKSGLRPRESHDLGSVRAILSTGSPLAPQSFDFVYRDIKRDVCLSSICGGTDLIGCFVAGNPAGPVWRGEAQALALGMDVAAFDEAGARCFGQKGELVCGRPLPSMPVGFWNDDDGARYRAAYFERYPEVWHHGDFVELTERGGMVIYGRSDAVLNPGGVRIGTAEIYRPVEQLDEVAEALAVGQAWGDDVRIVLFVRLRDGCVLDDALRDTIRARVRSEASPRHVPACIAQVPDLPRTKSGKITELAVREIIHGGEVRNVEALANPEALEHFRDRPELR